MSGDSLPILVGIVLVAAAAAFALLPFVRPSVGAAAAPLDAASPDRFALYQRVLELEFDRDLGKLSDDDFAVQSDELLAAAGTSLRLERGAVAEVDDEIEHEIAAARAAFAAVRAERRTGEPSAPSGSPSSETAGTPS
jgi:hypothetical protein